MQTNKPMLFFAILNYFIWSAESFLNNVSSMITDIMDERFSWDDIYSLDIFKEMMRYVTSSDCEVCIRSNYDEIDFKSTDAKLPRKIVKKKFEYFIQEFYAFDRFLGRIFSDILPSLLVDIKHEDDILQNIRVKFIEFAGYGYKKFDEAREFIKNVEDRWLFSSYVNHLTEKIEESNEHLDNHFIVLFCEYAKSFEKKLQVGQKKDLISKMTTVLTALEKEYEMVRSNIKSLPEKYECYYKEEITAMKKLLGRFGE